MEKLKTTLLSETKPCFCRVCEATETLVDLSEHRTAFNSITGIEVSETAFLCLHCIERLKAAYTFRQSALATNLKLQQVNKSLLDSIVSYGVEELPVVKHGQDESDEEESNGKLCPYCLKEFESSQERKEHIQGHIKENGGLECHFCNQKYLTKRLILTHIKKFHIKEGLQDHKLEFVCETCGKVFNKKICLDKHIKYVHEKVRTAVCLVCNKLFYNESHLRIHVLVHSKRKDFICSLCPMAFTQKGNLVEHEKTHLKALDFACDVCGKRFKRQRLVDNHRPLHFSTFPYECKCGKQFKSNTSYANHRKIHLNLEIPCTVCQKVLKSKEGLKRHMQLHTGELLDCEECGKKFHSRHVLKKHVKSAHQGLRFACEICQREYTQLENLKRHVKSLHS